jgi:hypothetical protein
MSEIKTSWQQRIQTHAVWMAEAWTTYCDREQARQVSIMVQSAENTRVFLRDCGINASLPVVKWVPQLQKAIESMPSADCRRKARGILAEWESYMDVCVAGNLEHLRAVSVANPKEYVGEMQQLRISDMSRSRLFVRVPSHILTERDFRFQHFEPLAVPVNSRKRKADTADLKGRAEEQTHLSQAIVEWLASVSDYARKQALSFARSMLQQEWTTLNEEPSLLRNARPIVYEDEDMKEEKKEYQRQSAPRNWDFLDVLLDAWSQHQASLRIDRLRKAHVRWMQCAQPWAVQSGQTQLAEFHVQLHNRLEKAPKPCEEHRRRLDAAILGRTRTWNAWLMQMGPNQEDQWRAMRAEERQRVEHFLEKDARMCTITNGYASQVQAASRLTATASASNIPHEPAASLEVKVLLDCTSPMSNSAEWQSERALWTQQLDSEWLPRTLKCEGQLQTWQWNLPAEFDRHIQQACDVPNGHNAPSFMQWLQWLRHATFALEWYTALL